MSFLYFTAQTESYPLSDFFTDVNAAADAQLKEPNPDDYIIDYSFFWPVYDDAYYTARDEWEEAQNRESVREMLAENTYDVTTYTMARYDNGKTTEIAQGLTYIPYGIYDAEKQIFLYEKLDGQKPATVGDVADLNYYWYDAASVRGHDWHAGGNVVPERKRQGIPVGYGGGHGTQPAADGQRQRGCRDSIQR